MSLTLGIDSGTQSTKVVLCDANGGIVAASTARHPEGCVQPPGAWWDALVAACAALPPGLREQVAAMSVGAQQHGCVPLGPGPDHRVLAAASLWCDTTSAPEAARLNGLADFAGLTGSRLVASFTISKLAATPTSTTAVCLPHDWLTWRLTGRLVSDRGDSSGTGWWAADAGPRRDLLALAGRPGIATPEVLGPDDTAGLLSVDAAAQLGLAPGIPVGVGTGDNMAAALGIGLAEGEAAVSLGTSGTVFAVSPRQTHDASGIVAGFADATGRFLPLACTLNCTRPVEVVAGWFGLDVATALDRADRPTDVTMLPYLLGERTPDLPYSSGAMLGLKETTEPAEILAAAVQGAAFGIALGVDALAAAGAPSPRRLVVVGGGARHDTWLHAIADATGLPVARPLVEEQAARGMAAQARAVFDQRPVRDVVEEWRPRTSDAVDPRPDRARGGQRRLLEALRSTWEDPTT